MGHVHSGDISSLSSTLVMVLAAHTIQDVEQKNEESSIFHGSPTGWVLSFSAPFWFGQRSGAILKPFRTFSEMPYIYAYSPTSNLV